MSAHKHWFTMRAVTIALFAGMVWLGFSAVNGTAAAVERPAAAISQEGLEEEIKTLLEEIAAERKWAIEQRFDNILTWLQEAVDAATRKKETSLAAIAESERQLNKAVHERAELVPEAGSWGLLASILYSARVSSVVIDGEILHEGDTIHGVKVVGINEDTVELAKDDERWQQKVGMTFPAEAGSV